MARFQSWSEISAEVLRRLVAPRIGGAALADGQLGGTSSVVFDAVAIVLSADAGAKLAREAVAVDWTRDAFSHLKTIAYDAGATAVLDAAGISIDAGVISAGLIRRANPAERELCRKLRKWVCGQR